MDSPQSAVLAVTGKDRFPAVPNVPTVIESGVVSGYDVTSCTASSPRVEAFGRFMAPEFARWNAVREAVGIE
jgi:tripartite-type tricarboxylate transporter receptor subunit TctC